MTPRQQKAAAIARALRRDFGEDAQVINSLPLDDAQQLRIQIIDTKRDAVVTALCEWGWHPQYLQIHHRVSSANYGLVPAAIYEVRIEEERSPVHDDRKIRGDIAERRKSDAELDAMKRAMGVGR